MRQFVEALFVKFDNNLESEPQGSGQLLFIEMSLTVEGTLQGELEDELGTLIRANVVVDRLEQKSLGGTTISIADIRYSSDRGESGKIRGKQTVVLLNEPDLDLPKFELSPQDTGILGNLSKLLGDGGQVKFDDVEEFCQQYRLHSWTTDAVSLLFNPALRRFMAARPGWSLRGVGSSLLVFRSNETVADTDVDAFVSDSLLILSQFQQAEESLDAHPGLSRQATPQDITTAANRMTGISGSMFRRVLEKYGSREEDVEQLVESAAPREIPKSVGTQVIGNNLPAFFLGILFVVVGVVLGGGLAVFGEGETQQVGAVFLFGFPLIGGAVSFFVMRHRVRKHRLLRDGILCPGEISVIENPSRPGSEGAYHTVKVKYDLNGEDRELKQYVNGMVASQAKKLVSSVNGVRVLVDPVDSAHALCVDLLFIVG